MTFQTTSIDVSGGVVVENSCCGAGGYYPRDVEIGKLSNPNQRNLFRTVSPEGIEDDTDLVIDQWMALSQPSIWKGANLICNSIGKSRLEVKRRTPLGDVVETNPFANDVLRRPSRWMTPFSWKREMALHPLLWGNYFGMIRRGRTMADGSRNISRAPTEIVTLNPFWTGLIRDEQTKRIMFFTSIEEIAGLPSIEVDDKIFVLIDPENVLHIPGLSFMNGWGLPVIDFWSGTIAISASVRKHLTSFYGRGANPSGLLRLPYGLSKDKREDFIESFSQAYTGMKAMNKVLVLEDDADFRTVTHSLNESQFSEVKQASDEDAARLLGLPPSSVGIAASVSYNSYEQARQQELDHGIDPHMCNIESNLDIKLQRVREHRDQTHFFQFNREDLKRVDDKTQREGDASDVNNGIATVNERRMRRGLPAHSDPNADRLRKPVNIGYIDDPTPVKGENPVKSTDDNDSDEENDSRNRLIRVSVRREVNKVCQSALRAAKDPKKLDAWLTEDWGLKKCQHAMAEAFSVVADAYEMGVECSLWQLSFVCDIKSELSNIIETHCAETYRDPSENQIKSYLTDQYIDDLMELIP